MTGPVREIPPPRSLAELLLRADALSGRHLEEIRSALGVRTHVGKGAVGELLETALGARGGPVARHDFPDLQIELKSVPVDEVGCPRESTYVCSLRVADAADAEWASSWVRAKLAHVLFLPVTPDACVGRPVFWRPTEAQDRVLAADFEAIVGLVGVGGVESLDAHVGRWLQARPKARDGRSRTGAWGPDGEWIETVPRGFYLRRRFTAALLADPTAMPG